MKLSDLKDFNIYFNPIKNFVLIDVLENRLVDANYSKQILYFSKYVIFLQKIYLLHLQEI